MRILHVYKAYPPVIGGIENHIQLLAEGQVARGLEVTVLVTGPTLRTSIEESPPPRVVRAGRLGELQSTPLSPAFFRWLSRLRADITHLHFPYPPGEIGHLLFGGRGKLVITYHSDIVRQKGLLFLYRGLLRHILRRADRIIASNPNYLRSSEYLRDLGPRCEVIAYGVDLDRMRQADRRQSEDIRRRHGSPLVLFVGRLRYYKGLPYLLAAMRGIPAKLLIVGSGPMAKEWQALCADLDLEQRVTFVGEVSDASLPAYYRACDVFVLPASQRSEAFGLVLAEAMAAGRPVVSTNLETGTSYVNLDGETGFVVPPRDPQALSRAIGVLLDDAELRSRMGQAGHRRVEQEFSKDLMVRRTIDLYRRVLEGEACGGGAR